MKFGNSYEIAISELVLNEKDRQRQDHDVSDILPSIKHRGIYNPIIIDENKVIQAGGRRYKAALEAGLTTVPVRPASDLSDVEREILELEENTRRKDLDWKETALAYARIHDIYLSLYGEEWSASKTADAINVSQPTLSKNLAVAAEFRLGNEKVLSASGLSAGYGLIQRNRERAVEDAVGDISHALQTRVTNPAHLLRKSSSGATATPSLPAVVAPPLAFPNSVMVTDFITWTRAYHGQPFNFIHCDFPYGVGMDTSEQGASVHGSYEDSPEVYEKLILTLCENIDTLLSASGHLFFWLSADNEVVNKTLAMFATFAPSLTFWPRPLIWHKTDNKGIIQDAQRGPRHVYEAALVASRGDRKIVKAGSDVYGAPSDKSGHQSIKPEPMLKYFFQQYVDENTRMLDPTCGAGSALRAAEHCGASSVLGLEINADYAKLAADELRRFRLLRKVAP